MTLSIPTVHLNGTGAESLVDQNRTAYSAVQDAIDALCQAAPHGRDYYTQGPDAFTVAAKAHRARVEKLQQVSDELLEITMKVMDLAKL